MEIFILLVEDDKNHTELILRVFEDCPEMKVIPVSSIGEAKEHLLHMTPDLILTDWKLPDGFGTEMISIRNSGAEVPMIIMTSYGNEELAVNALKSGFMDYLVKSPENFQKLPRLIRAAMEAWRFMDRERKILQDITRNDGLLSGILENIFIPVLLMECTDVYLIFANGKAKELLKLNENNIRQYKMENFLSDSKQIEDFRDGFSKNTPIENQKVRLQNTLGNELWVQFSAGFCEVRGNKVIVATLQRIQE